ncbi:MAG TPA: hypothetical protein VMV01_06280, partial [Planctomycetota bacterium]|nr:hypothetical protein [Planctomycetota bacterium]
LAHLDVALLGYLGATLVAAFATTWRVSAYWRRPAAAIYARALLGALTRPRTLLRTGRTAARDLGAQRFIAQRSRARWLAHLLLSLGTLASFAITLPLVFGWLHFEADGQESYRAVLFGALPALRFGVEGALGWLVFHALSVAGVAVAAGAATFLALRMRVRREPGTRDAFHVAPLVLLLVVALTGLLLPLAGRLGSPLLMRVAAVAHEASVVVLLVALPFSKLGHLLLRPLALGAQAMRAPNVPRARCVHCGAPLAPAAQQAAVAALLAARGFRFAAHPTACPGCRRRLVASTQAALVGADFQPRLVSVRAARGTTG